MKSIIVACAMLMLCVMSVGCQSERVCSLDQSSMHIIKCWGDCPNDDSVCRLRWRALGSEDEWQTEHSDYRNRDPERDQELEYSCFCEQP